MEAALAAVRSLKGKYNVQEKSAARREVIVKDDVVEVNGLVSNTDLNGRLGGIPFPRNLATPCLLLLEFNFEIDEVCLPY